MADLTFLEKQRFEKLFGMGSGYVLRFSDKTFREFVYGTTGRNIYDEKYNYASGSKANRLRAFWSEESNALAGKLLNDMLQLLGEEKPEVRNSEAYQQCSEVVRRLVGLKKGNQPSGSDTSDPQNTSHIDRNVFVVYGRDIAAKRGIVQFLRAIGLNPIDFSRAIESTGKASPYIGEVLNTAFAQAQGHPHSDDT
jgi:hypothetical protein